MYVQHTHKHTDTHAHMATHAHTYTHTHTDKHTDRHRHTQMHIPFTYKMFTNSGTRYVFIYVVTTNAGFILEFTDFNYRLLK